jgi:hypothetical protein
VIVTAVEALTTVVSGFVFTVNPAAAYVPAVGFVIPAIVKMPVALLAKAHPLVARVTVTV